jgi:hypothetical protein
MASACRIFYNLHEPNILLRWLSSGMWRLVVWNKLADVSEVLTASVIRTISCYYTAQHPRRQSSSHSPPRKSEISLDIYLLFNGLMWLLRERHQISRKFLISPTAISWQRGAVLLWKHTEIYSDVGNNDLWKTDAFESRPASRVKHFQFVKIWVFGNTCINSENT